VVSDVPVDDEAPVVNIDDEAPVVTSRISDVPVDDEAPVVTSRIFRSAGAQSFGCAHRSRVCIHVFIGCECACTV